MWRISWLCVSLSRTCLCNFNLSAAHVQFAAKNLEMIFRNQITPSNSRLPATQKRCRQLNSVLMENGWLALVSIILLFYVCTSGV